MATKDSPLHSTTYQSLVGLNESSWGWELRRSIFLHDCNHDYPEFSNLYVENIFSQADCLKLLLDMDAGTLAFMVDDTYLGVAFTGLRGHTLYPIISVVWGHCEVQIRYINSLPAGGEYLRQIWSQFLMNKASLLMIKPMFS